MTDSIDFQIAETTEQLQCAADILREAAQWMIDTGNPNWDPAVFSAETVRQTPDAVVYLALVDGEPAGTLQLVRYDPFFWPNLADPYDALFMHKVAVRRRFAGQGVAYKMFDAVCDLARAEGRPFVRVECRGDRPKLCAFYGHYFEYVDDISLRPKFTTARFKIAV